MTKPTRRSTTRTTSRFDDTTVFTFDVDITAIGPKAKMAAFGMKWGYKSHLDALGELLT